MSTEQKHDATPKSQKYSQHTKDDAAFAADDQKGNGKQRGLTILGKIAVFFGFPTLVGFIGLYMGYLASLHDPTRKVSFDIDFAMPFVLALSMVVVIGLQTRNYTSKKVDPLVSWPKVKKRKKIVHKHVVAGDAEPETRSSQKKND